MRKIIILTLSLLIISSCITVTFEPYWGDEQLGQRTDYPHKVTESSKK